MEILPIQVTDSGVLIPHVYLRQALDFDIIVEGEYVIVKPLEHLKDRTTEAKASRSIAHRFSFVGIGHTRNPDASSQVEEILTREGFETVTQPTD